MDYRVAPASSQKRGSGLTLIIGILAVLFGLAFLFKLSGMFRLPIPIDDRILQYATSIFSVICGFYMIYRTLFRPRVHIG